MTPRSLLVLLWLLAVPGGVLLGCGDDDGGANKDVTELDDGGDVEVGDPCAELQTCARAGARCVGPILTTCAVDAATGCIVTTEEQDCGATEFGLCDELASEAGPACAVRHPCDGVSNCSAVGRVCEDDVLVACELDAVGCRVERRLDCSETGLRCDDRGEHAFCGYDPCDDVANPCFAAGRTCNGEVLEVCEADVFGCLALHTYDCAALDTTCTTAGSAARCDDPTACVQPAPCSAEGAACNGTRLNLCHRDAFGCFEQVVAQCNQTQVGAGFCHAEAAPRPACTITFNEACPDTDTCQSVGRRCDGDVLVDCSPNADACLVETRSDCGATAMVCVLGSDDEPACVDPCSLVNSCPSEVYCDGDKLMTCIRNDDNCLVPDPAATVDCSQTGLACDASLTPPACAVPPIVTVSSSPNQAIYDEDTVTDTINVATACAAVVSLKVDVNISHSYIGDLTVKLRGPAGTVVTLHGRTGGGTDNLVGNYPDDFNPVDSLNAFVGTNGAGTWTLEVSDNASGDTGQLNTWGLTIQCG